MIGLLGKKVGMTQIFDDEGRQIPVTVIELGPCHVTDVKTKEKHGYSAVQLGFDKNKEQRFNKPQQGQFKKASAPCLNFVREIRTDDTEGVEVGSELKVDNFESGDFVDIEGVSIGKGFQGVVKRHGFKGGATTTHGNKTGRKPGSTGMSAYPARTIKGTKLPGQTGNKKLSVQNLKVVKVDLENDLLAVKGAVPGFDGAYVVVKTSVKKGEARKWKLPASSAEEPAGEAEELKEAPVAVEEGKAPQDKAPQEAKSSEESKPAVDEKSAASEKDK